MVRAFLGSITSLLIVLAPLTTFVAANDFKIDIAVGEKEQQVHNTETWETPSNVKLPARQVAKFAAGQPVHVAWHVENTSKSTEFKGVLVHFFVVREKEVGQATVPDLGRNVSYEGALTTDFQPGDKADWEWTLNVPEPGSYLLRVETIGMRQSHGHEHFAALDLAVESSTTTNEDQP